MTPPENSYHAYIQHMFTDQEKFHPAHDSKRGKNFRFYFDRERIFPIPQIYISNPKVYYDVTYVPLYVIINSQPLVSLGTPT